MRKYIEKPKENKSKAVANSVGQRKGDRKQGIGFVDNRSNKYKVIQCQSKVHYQQPINYTYGPGNNVNVSGGVDAYLDMNDPMQGEQTPGMGTPLHAANTAATGVTGVQYHLMHLLNGRLGGVGTSQNLVPGPQTANQVHAFGVETELKRRLAAQNPAVNVPTVHYEARTLPVAPGNFGVVTPGANPGWNMVYKIRQRDGIGGNWHVESKGIIDADHVGGANALFGAFQPLNAWAAPIVSNVNRHAVVGAPANLPTVPNWGFVNPLGDGVGVPINYGRYSNTANVRALLIRGRAGINVGTVIGLEL